MTRTGPRSGSMHATTVLVVEVGGTTLRAARFDTGTATLEGRVRADAPGPGELGVGSMAAHRALLETLRRLGARALGGRRPDVVAVAYPGPIDPDGVVLAAPTLLGIPGAERFPLQGACEETWPGARVVVANDLTAAGYRYSDPAADDFCVLTVGSGIGHKVFVGGAPLLGPGGRGGEIGHLLVDTGPDAPVCDCGSTGHLGGIASGRGVVRLVQTRAERDPEGFRASLVSGHAARPPDVGAGAIAAAFADDDAWVRSTIEIAAGHLGWALAAIHLSTGVERFVLIGGFAFAMGEPYRRMLVRSAGDACWDLGQNWDAMVSFGIPDDDQGMAGVGMLAVRTGLVGGR